MTRRAKLSLVQNCLRATLYPRSSLSSFKIDPLWKIVFVKTCLHAILTGSRQKYKLKHLLLVFIKLTNLHCIN